jgi:magnesium transporter
MGIVNLVRVYIMNGQNLMLSVTVTCSLFFTILVAKTVGGLLPILAKRLKIDPAIMAAPMITTIVDAISLVIYFSIAKSIMGL